jgi:hypothetical protein
MFACSVIVFLQTARAHMEWNEVIFMNKIKFKVSRDLNRGIERWIMKFVVVASDANVAVSKQSRHENTEKKKVKKWGRK